MNDLNCCQFIGRLGKDVESRFMQNGDQVVSFSLAVGWKGKDKEGTEWVNIVAFGKLAEICAKYLKKGSQVYIQGRLTTDKVERDGKTSYYTKVVADKLQMLGSKSDGGKQEADNAQYSHAPGMKSETGGFGDMEDDIPF